jgi:hypothetical protein
MEPVRVTEVLKPFTGFKNIPSDEEEREKAASQGNAADAKWVSAVMQAAQRGTAVHAICAAIALEDWVPNEMIQESLRGYVKSFRIWVKKFVYDFLVIEKRYTDEDRGYTGQTDFIVKYYDGRTVLVDLKTTAGPSKTHPVQVAAYAQLAEIHGQRVDAVALVYLDKYGQEPQYEEYDETVEALKGIFNSALTCYNYFSRRRIPRGKPISENPQHNGGDIVHSEGGKNS